MKRNLTILFLLLSNLLFAHTIRVGQHERITSLQAGIEAAQDGDTVLLQKGLYKEGNIIINKSIILLGEGNPVLDGENKYEILTVSANGIVIKGLTLQNTGYTSLNDLAAIKLVDTWYARVEENTIYNAYFAIHVANSAYCAILHNTIKSTPKTETTSGNGVHLWKCENMLVKGNDIRGHRDGIYLEFVTNSIIEANNSHQNMRYGLHFMFSNYDSYYHNTFRENGAGVAVMYSHHVVMYNNDFQRNWGENAYGLLLKEISDGEIMHNNFQNNTIAILMEGTNRVHVADNDFTGNGYAIRMQASCSENLLQFNNFTANTFDMATNGSLMLNKMVHNYWDKYEGYDMNKDGLGDVPYHPISMYSMVIEQNPNAAILMRSFMVTLLDKAEKAIPSLTPENMADTEPIMKRSSYDQNRKRTQEL